MLPWTPSSSRFSILRVTASRGWYEWGGLHKYRRKKKVSAQTKYFAQRKVNVPPASRFDVKWSRPRLVLTLVGYNWEVRGINVVGVGHLGSGACSWDMHAFPLVLFSSI